MEVKFINQSYSSNKVSILDNNKGLATFEAIPMLIIFLVLITYGMGYFGAIHTAILNSISARTYAFDTFRNRTNLRIFRENSFTGGYEAKSFRTHGMRWHGVESETNINQEKKFPATARNITFGKFSSGEPKGRTNDHMVKVMSIPDGRNGQGGVEINPIWIQVGYGLCLTVACGD